MDTLDSEDGGYNITIIGPNGDIKEGAAEDALLSYLGTGLELCLSDSLKLTSQCPSGYGHVIRMEVLVTYVTKVTIIFESATGDDVREVIFLFIPSQP